MAKQYNGHRSWNAWNVSLWLHNDERLYRAMMDTIGALKNKDKAARHLALALHGDRTPDGGKYNYTTIRLAMRDV